MGLFLKIIPYRSACAFTTKTGYERLDKLLFPETVAEDDEKPMTKRNNGGRALKVMNYFKTVPQLNEIRSHIPPQYFIPKRRLKLEHLYLVDSEIAKSIALKILPYLKKNKEHIICETNAGLGLIAAELLDNGVEFIRLYESCYDFHQTLKLMHDTYPKRVELFVKDIFHLSIMSHIDRFDRGNRVEQLLKGVPKKNWTSDPVMTIIGPMPNINFIQYLIKMLSLQSGIVTYGRIQIFALMKPMYYYKFTAAPGMSLHTYTTLSILFQLFFECVLLEKYPRKSFLPWETELKIGPHTRKHCKIDADYIYLVRINFKKELPVDIQHLLHLYYFINQGVLRGRSKIIPKVEKWLPGIGVNLIIPKQKLNYFPEMSIYTEFGQLKPVEILQIFLEILQHPEFNNSPFAALIESDLLKRETIESDLAEATARHSTSN